MKFITRVLHRNVYHEILNSYSQNRTGAETQTQQLDYFFSFYVSRQNILGSFFLTSIALIKDSLNTTWGLLEDPNQKDED